MDSLFDAKTGRRRELPPAMRRPIVDLKAEHPSLNLSEISSVVYVRFGRRPDGKTVGWALEEEPWPLGLVKRFAPTTRYRRRGNAGWRW